jgi:hypothetical protein
MMNPDLTIILTVIGTAAAIIGSNIALMSWLRADMKAFEADIKSDMKAFETDIKSDMKAFETEIRGWKEEIQKESRDFHGRLCALSERNIPKTNP